MKQRWNVVAKTEDGEIINLVIRGDNEKMVRHSAFQYKGVRKIIDVQKRITERTFPEPPAHLVGIHYRPLKR